MPIYIKISCEKCNTSSEHEHTKANTPEGISFAHVASELTTILHGGHFWRMTEGKVLCFMCAEKEEKGNENYLAYDPDSDDPIAWG